MHTFLDFFLWDAAVVKVTQSQFYLDQANPQGIKYQNSSMYEIINTYSMNIRDSDMPWSLCKSDILYSIIIKH